MTGQRGVLYFHLVMFLFSMAALPLLSCSPHKAHVQEHPESVSRVEPSPVSFQKIILYRFDGDEGIAPSVPDAISRCENSTLRELLNLGSASMIVKASSHTPRQKDTLIVKARLVMIRKTSYGRGKKSSPETGLAVHVRLIDASNGKTLAEEQIGASSSASAKRTPDAPAELGAAVARYVDKFIRKQ